jgi:2-polyprenyl-6-methoxyphenol hydroxylase-like FAD-dependent oxidoreductase
LKSARINTENYPHVAIIGGGIGGAASGLSTSRYSVYFYERDDRFEARSQGYGLTLQQASKIKGLGIASLERLFSTKHIVHNTEGGKVLGEWGMRKWA